MGLDYDRLFLINQATIFAALSRDSVAGYAVQHVRELASAPETAY
jgi:hypothetical protein